MILVIPIMFYGLLVLIVTALGAMSLGPLRQVLRERSRPVSRVTAGPVEVTGTLVADGPVLETLLGEKALVIVTRVTYSYRGANGKTYSDTTAFEDVRIVPFHVTDGQGRCQVDADGAVVLGIESSLWGAADEMRQKHPWLAETFAFPKNAVSIYVDQKYVPAGVEGLVSGEAVEVGSEGDAADYRAAHATYRLESHPERPLIVAGHDESVVRRKLLRPALMAFALAAFGSGVFASLVWIVRRIGD